MNDKLTNKVLSGIGAPIPEIYSSNLTLLLDNYGNILDKIILDPVLSSGHFIKLSRLLKEAGNINRIFDFPKPGDLSIYADTRRTFDEKGESFFIEEGLEFFYSALPVSHIALFRVSENRLAGIILQSNFLPNIFERASGGFLYLDKKDRIVGFNQSFYELFKGIAANPADILNQPASRFLDTVPSTFQRKYIEGIRIPAAGQFALAAGRDYTLAAPDQTELVSAKDELRLSPDGAHWSAPDSRGSYITFAFPVNITLQDIRVRFTVKSDSPSFPCIILGDTMQGHAVRDGNGYLIGPNSGGTKVILKRMGFTVAGECTGPLPQGPISVEFLKINDAFLLFINGQRVFAYYDIECLERDETFLSLFLRHGGECLLKNVEIRIRPREVPSERRRMFVQLKNGRENYYLLNPLYSFYLSNKEADYLGYKLQDITEFQYRLKTLEEEYLKKLEAEKRLSLLLEKYKRDQDEWVGSGKQSALIKEKALRISVSTATVLLQGPTGSGKEVMAQFIHRHSAYAKGPFVKVDCSTLPKSLMESILFGHEKGAFTGAYKRNIGMLEQAQGGTLFLDEVNNLSAEAQAKLLQFLQDYRIVRVGGDQPIKLNVRILVASNLNLKEMVDKGRFREDLYYRMAVVTIDLPRLVDRLEELPELAGYFLEHFNRVNSKQIKGFSPAAHKKLYGYSWPGNVRELKNMIERAVLFCEGEEITEEQLLLPEAGKPGVQGRAAGERKEYQPLQITREELLAAAEKHHGVIKKIAQEFNVSRRSLYYHLERIGITPNDFRKIPRRKAR